MKILKNITLITTIVTFAAIVLFNPITSKMYSQNGLQKKQPYLSAFR